MQGFQVIQAQDHEYLYTFQTVYHWAIITNSGIYSIHRSKSRVLTVNYNTTSSCNTCLHQIRNAYYHCDLAYNQLPTSQLSSIYRAIFGTVTY